MKFGAILLSVLATSVFNTEAAPTPKTGSTAQYVFQVNNGSSFCSFLPSQPGQLIAPNEKTGVPFCTQEGLGGQLFPQDFLVSAEFTTTDTFVQIRATINNAAYSLQSTDGGGQYDYHDVSGKCVGYSYFVNLLEPDSQDLCIRCCQNQEDCDINHSGYGCDRVIPEVSTGTTTTVTFGSGSNSTSSDTPTTSFSDSTSEPTSEPTSDSTDSSDSTADPTDTPTDSTADPTVDPTDSSNSTDESEPTPAN